MIEDYDGNRMTPKKAAALEIQAVLNDHVYMSTAINGPKMSDRERKLVEGQYNEFLRRITTKILTILEE